MSVSVAHVGLDSSDQSIAYQTEDPQQKTEAHASGGKDKGSEEHAHRESYGTCDWARLADILRHRLRYIKREHRSVRNHKWPKLGG